jgi:hypothetical protein
LPSISKVENLKISDEKHWFAEMEHVQWVELLQPFTSVKDLVISKDLAWPFVTMVRKLVQENVTCVLPALQNLFLDEPRPNILVWEDIGLFIAARRLSGYPVNVYHRGLNRGREGWVHTYRETMIDSY